MEHSNGSVAARFNVQEAGEANSSDNANAKNHEKVPWPRKYRWWLKIVIYTIFVLCGQTVATLLGRLYYDKGGKSKWMGTLVQTAGFPILLPILFFSPAKNDTTDNCNHHPKQPSLLVLTLLYLFLGLLLAGDCMLYSIGLLYLPVSTYSLICASQLGFNAFFSVFLNSQKLTPFIINSLVLLTVSSILLVFQSNSKETFKKGKYVIGFLCTVAASAGWSFLLSVTQLAFRRILKRENFRVVLDMIIYRSLVATCFILVGLFASNEWKSLEGEMEGYALGKSSYVLTLVWIAISWKVYAIGSVGLIFEVSSLFSNVICTLGLPIVPILAVFFFGDKMTGVKVVAMLLAMWGFVSYVYQHYIDDFKSKPDSKNQVPEASLTERH